MPTTKQIAHAVRESKNAHDRASEMTWDRQQNMNQWVHSREEMAPTWSAALAGVVN